MEKTIKNMSYNDYIAEIKKAVGRGENLSLILDRHINQKSTPLNVLTFAKKFKDELIEFNCSFDGRLNGAIGVTYPIKKTILAIDEDMAYMVLYADYEHIQYFKCNE